MIKRLFRGALIMLALCSVNEVLPMERLKTVPWTWTETENELVGKIVELYSAAIEGDLFTASSCVGDAPVEFCVPYSDVDGAGCGVELSLEQYPQSLVGQRYKSSTPSEALEKFSKIGPMGAKDLLVDGSQPLRLQSHAARSAKPLCPFLMRLKIKGWPELTSLRFLQHPALVEDNTFRHCLSYLQVAACGISKFDSSFFQGYSNLIDLDLHNNCINELVVRRAVSSVLDFVENLNLANNSIVDLAEAFTSGWSRLQRLDLSDNSITEITGGAFRGLIFLYSLDLSNNLLRSGNIAEDAFDGISSSAPLFKLVIYLANNVLSAFPPVPQSVASKLIRLDLDGNPIMTIDGDVDFAEKFSSLRVVSLVYDPRTDGENAALIGLLQALSEFSACRVIIERPVGDGYSTP